MLYLSPVAKIVTVRSFLALAAAHGWPLHQIDVNNTFLHGYLDEDLYTCWPYGPSVYVDDILVTCSSLDDIQSVKDYLHSLFTIKDRGGCKVLPWSRIACNSKRKHIEIDCHVVRDAYKERFIAPLHIRSKFQVVDLFTKAPRLKHFVDLLSKLGLVAFLPSPTCGGAVENVDDFALKLQAAIVGDRELQTQHDGDDEEDVIFEVAMIGSWVCRRMERVHGVEQRGTVYSIPFYIATLLASFRLYPM
ncbi:UNVERIFIED_CONTAM: hypothetical protein Sradi_6471200 [Sesamum radiatum]|uniref:Reverse transcriptase Ty1/copia-type domain-containing protein n=1 Tax=Sesamum radiatum TaxID=300843 RepID=A0AAW2K5Z2_SESRA